jgi:hypothetical protein
MPTGYTAAIADGISFKDFALNCARAFGACVTLGDEPGGGKNIPERFEPSDYHQKAGDKARGELATLDRMTAVERETAAWHQLSDADAAYRQGIAKDKKAGEQYAAMLAKVRAWKPPTDEHVGLKNLMIEQIESSIKWDCGHEEARPVKLTGDEWAAGQRNRLQWGIDYHDTEQRAEEKRAAGRTEWVQALRKSL